MPTSDPSRSLDDLWVEVVLACKRAKLTDARAIAAADTIASAYAKRFGSLHSTRTLFLGSSTTLDPESSRLTWGELTAQLAAKDTSERVDFVNRLVHALAGNYYTPGECAALDTVFDAVLRSSAAAPDAEDTPPPTTFKLRCNAASGSAAAPTLSKSATEAIDALLDIPAQIAEEVFADSDAVVREQCIRRWRGKLANAADVAFERLKASQPAPGFLGATLEELRKRSVACYEQVHRSDHVSRARLIGEGTAYEDAADLVQSTLQTVVGDEELANALKLPAESTRGDLLRAVTSYREDWSQVCAALRLADSCEAPALVREIEDMRAEIQYACDQLAPLCGCDPGRMTLTAIVDTLAIRHPAKTLAEYVAEAQGEELDAIGGAAFPRPIESFCSPGPDELMDDASYRAHLLRTLGALAANVMVGQNAQGGKS